MTAVIHLVPGNVVRDPQGAEHTYVAQTPHPLYRSLQLVIWPLADGTWSFDALSPMRDVGQVLPFTPATLTERLRAALLGDGDRRTNRKAGER